MNRLQFVWWGRFPAFKLWHYPREGRFLIFKALYLGLFEIRYFVQNKEKL